MSSDPSSEAPQAVLNRMEQLGKVYAAVKGRDAQRLYSASIIASDALGFSLMALNRSVGAMFEAQNGRVHRALDAHRQMLQQGAGPRPAASDPDDPGLFALRRSVAEMSVLVAGASFRAAKLTHETTRFILACVDIVCVGVIACVRASDRHYQDEAIKRFIELVKGFAEDAADPVGILGTLKECLTAAHDILLARVMDAKNADDIFARERSYQDLTHLAGLQVEQLRLVIDASIEATSRGNTPGEVSLQAATDAWLNRVEESTRMLVR
jgi:hypothetical protein